MKIEAIKKSMPLSARKHLLAHMEGRRITVRQAVAAKCFECMNGFIDGRQDCAIPDCPLYPWMPFNPNKPAKTARKTDFKPFGRPFVPKTTPKDNSTPI